jgi:hypothetical protein
MVFFFLRLHPTSPPHECSRSWSQEGCALDHSYGMYVLVSCMCACVCLTAVLAIGPTLSFYVRAFQSHLHFSDTLTIKTLTRSLLFWMKTTDNVLFFPRFYSSQVFPTRAQRTHTHTHTSLYVTSLCSLYRIVQLRRVFFGHMCSGSDRTLSVYWTQQRDCRADASRGCRHHKCGAYFVLGWDT